MELLDGCVVPEMIILEMRLGSRKLAFVTGFTQPRTRIFCHPCDLQKLVRLKLYPLNLGFLERFCTALSTSQLDFATKKLLMIPRSFQKQKYDEWKEISEVVSSAYLLIRLLCGIISCYTSDVYCKS